MQIWRRVGLKGKRMMVEEVERMIQIREAPQIQ
jgi:hypothetical protein